MPLTGDAKAAYNERYYRARRVREVTATLRPREMKTLEGIVSGKSVAAALTGAGFHPSSSTMRQRLRPGGDLAEGLQVLLKSEGLTLQTLVSKTQKKLDAQRRYGSGEDAIVADDNDAQLRAVEIGLRLHERAGTIPSAPGNGGGGTTINVFEVLYSPQIQDQRLIPAIDAPPDADPRVIDAQVLGFSDDA